MPLGFNELRDGFGEEFMETKNSTVLTKEKYAFYQLKYIKILNIHSHNEKVYFPEVLWACMS
jgi:hypothetical protein